MNQQKSIINALYGIGISLSCIGLFFGNSLLSIGTILFYIAAMLHLYVNKIRIRVDKLSIALLLLFFIYAIGGLIKNPSFLEVLNLWKDKIVFLLLAISITALPGNKKLDTLLLVGINLLIIGVGVYAISNYILDYRFWEDAYSKGNVLPTFLHHSKYTFLIIINGIYVYRLTKSSSNKLKKVGLAVCLYYFLLLHLLAIKTGLLLLYVSIIWMVWIEIKSYKKFVFIPIVLISLYGSTKLPLIKNKIDYLLYDMHQLDRADFYNYSDARRIISIKKGIEIFKHHKYVGVGYCNVKNEIQQAYKTTYGYFDDTKMMYPHNTYVHLAAGGGIWAILLLIAAILFTEYAVKGNKYSFLMLCLFGLFACWEALLEQQKGIFLLSLIIVYIRKLEHSNNASSTY